MARSTFSRVVADTRSGWFKTFDTVPWATPASAATSPMPARVLLPTRGPSDWPTETSPSVESARSIRSSPSRTSASLTRFNRRWPSRAFRDPIHGVDGRHHASETFLKPLHVNDATHYLHRLKRFNRQRNIGRMRDERTRNSTSPGPDGPGDGGRGS